jgi:cytochrome c oxidase assembly factor 6
MPEKEKEKFLKKAERAACWDAKDQFWACMDKAGGAEPGSACRETRNLYEKLCPQSWVAHFDRKYEYEKFKVKLQTEGFQRVDEKYTSK